MLMPFHAYIYIFTSIATLNAYFINSLYELQYINIFFLRYLANHEHANSLQIIVVTHAHVDYLYDYLNGRHAFVTKINKCNNNKPHLKQIVKVLQYTISS